MQKECAMNSITFGQPNYKSPYGAATLQKNMEKKTAKMSEVSADSYNKKEKNGETLGIIAAVVGVTVGAVALFKGKGKLSGTFNRIRSTVEKAVTSKKTKLPQATTASSSSKTAGKPTLDNIKKSFVDLFSKIGKK